MSARQLWFVPAFGLLVLAFALLDAGHPWLGLLCIPFALFCNEVAR